MKGPLLRILLIILPDQTPSSIEGVSFYRLLYLFFSVFSIFPTASVCGCRVLTHTMDNLTPSFHRLLPPESIDLAAWALSCWHLFPISLSNSFEMFILPESNRCTLSNQPIGYNITGNLDLHCVAKSRCI
jgi:hypothetical protein